MCSVTWDCARQQWQENVQQGRVACCRLNSSVFQHVVCNVQKWPTTRLIWVLLKMKQKRSWPGLQYEDSTTCQLLYYPPRGLCNTVLWPKKNKSVISQCYGAKDIHRWLLSRKENDSQEPLDLHECLEKLKKVQPCQTLPCILSCARALLDPSFRIAFFFTHVLTRTHAIIYNVLC